MTDLEAKIAALEAQVAELTKDKAEWEKRAIAWFLQSQFIKKAGDALAVRKDNDLVSKGLYCRHCIEKDGRFTLLPLEWDEIPGATSSPRSFQCPIGHRLLSIRWEN